MPPTESGFAALAEQRDFQEEMTELLMAERSSLVRADSAALLALFAELEEPPQ
jgi:hypothetical protein